MLPLMCPDLYSPGVLTSTIFAPLFNMDLKSNGSDIPNMFFIFPSMIFKFWTKLQMRKKIYSNLCYKKKVGHNPLFKSLVCWSY